MIKGALAFTQWNLDTTKGQGTDKTNMFAITKFRYVGVLFHIFSSAARISWEKL